MGLTARLTVGITASLTVSLTVGSLDQGLCGVRVDELFAVGVVATLSGVDEEA